MTNAQSFIIQSATILLLLYLFILKLIMMWGLYNCKCSIPVYCTVYSPINKEYLFESMLNGLMFVYTVFRIFFYRFHDFVLQDDLAEATKSFRCLEIVGVFFWWCIRHFTLTVFPLIFSPSVCICVCMDEWECVCLLTMETRTVFCMFPIKNVFPILLVQYCMFLIQYTKFSKAMFDCRGSLTAIKRPWEM